MAPKRGGPPVPLGEAIREFLRDSGVRGSATGQRVFEAWSSVLTEAERAHATPVRFQRGTLTVEVDSGVFMHELKNIKAESYRRRANERLGTAAIRKVVFRARSHGILPPPPRRRS